MAGGLALVAGLLAIWLGLGWTVERFEHSTPGDLSHDRRVSIYRDTLHIVRDHPWTGTGLGTLETVFPRYESHYDGLVVDHAHNDYLELLAETGLIVHAGVHRAIGVAGTVQPPRRKQSCLSGPLFRGCGWVCWATDTQHGGFQLAHPLQRSAISSSRRHGHVWHSRGRPEFSTGIALRIGFSA